MASVREQGRAFAAAPAIRFRRFGLDGPVYEVERIEGALAFIRVIESGETLEYPVDRLEQDPAA
ncbi:MAG: DUF5397 family protein [Brevundimonas sp.]|uniref:DUF5397 family protein n=1 Tax=Brevundimonas sp. TaxID=1871086 RepID=UPI0025BFB1EB|nr:DUF5397 family protein [Brevundimonas sp.]MBX3477631.1 DUF5397 family protein [Brevundimonas sp.]